MKTQIFETIPEYLSAKVSIIVTVKVERVVSSMIVSTCDDYCTFQVSKVGDVGCTADLETYGRADAWKSSLLGRTEYSGTYDLQDKLYLEKDSQYYFIFTHVEGGGGDFAEFGFIYHGTDPEENMNHAGFTKDTVSNIPEVNYVREEQVIILENSSKISTWLLLVMTQAHLIFYCVKLKRQLTLIVFEQLT